MSDDDWEAFSDRSPKLLVQTGARASAAPLYVWPRPGRDRTEVWILHFAAECLELPDPTSIVAHECAHVVAGHTHIGEPNAKEREADAITMRWGFGAQGNVYDDTVPTVTGGHNER